MAPVDIFLSTAQPPVSLTDETQMSSPRTCTPFGVCMRVDAEVCSCLHIKAVCKNAFLFIWEREPIEGERQIRMQNVAELIPLFQNLLTQTPWLRRLLPHHRWPVGAGWPTQPSRCSSLWPAALGTHGWCARCASVLGNLCESRLSASSCP